jgi:hypothetical protein
MTVPFDILKAIFSIIYLQKFDFDTARSRLLSRVPYATQMKFLVQTFTIENVFDRLQAARCAESPAC